MSEFSINKADGEYLITLLGCAVRDEIPPLPPEGVQWERLYRIAKAHTVDATVFRAVKAGGACPPSLLPKWERASLAALRYEMLFDAEREEIYSALEKAGVDYIPIKGILLKTLYPHKGMRRFSDNDILYDPTKVEQVRTVMHDLGYTAKGYKVAHDMFEKEPIFNFEMHRALFSDKYPFHVWFDTVWERAERYQGHEYRLKKEDEFVYLLAHFQKHYEDTGAGLRFFVDLYLSEEKGSALDWEYVRKALEETELTDFYTFVSATVDEWFRGGAKQLSDENFNFILSGGVYGSARNAITNKRKQYGKKFLWYMIFPPYREMKNLHPVLEKCPVLLPFFWIFRILSMPFYKTKREKAKRAIASVFRRKKKKDR